MSYETDAADTSSASTDHNHSWLQLCRNKCLIICVKASQVTFSVESLMEGEELSKVNTTRVFLSIPL